MKHTLVKALSERNVVTQPLRHVVVQFSEKALEGLVGSEVVAGEEALRPRVHGWVPASLATA